MKMHRSRDIPVSHLDVGCRHAMNVNVMPLCFSWPIWTYNTGFLYGAMIRQGSLRRETGPAGSSQTLQDVARLMALYIFIRSNDIDTCGWFGPDCSWPWILQFLLILLAQTLLVFDLVLDSVPQRAPWHSKDGSAGCWSGWWFVPTATWHVRIENSFWKMLSHREIWGMCCLGE